MSPATAPARVAGFSLTVPATWFEVDVAPATRSSSINELVTSRIRTVPALAEHGDAVARMLRRIAREAHASGAVYCAAMVEPVEGAGMTASVTVSTVRAARPDGTPLDSDPDLVASSLRHKTAKDEDDTWQQVEVVDLPGAGRAARAYGVDDIDLPEGAGWVRSVVMQTLVPIPGTDRVAVISCSSPNLTLVEGLHDVFDAITSTFQFIVDEGGLTTG